MHEHTHIHTHSKHAHMHTSTHIGPQTHTHTHSHTSTHTCTQTGTHLHKHMCIHTAHEQIHKCTHALTFAVYSCWISGIFALSRALNCPLSLSLAPRITEQAQPQCLTAVPLRQRALNISWVWTRSYLCPVNVGDCFTLTNTRAS